MTNANPASEARHLYYSFLRKLIHVKCKVIMTAGNHDSPAVLNGPKDILAMLNIDIVANAYAAIDEGIIELKRIFTSLKELVIVKQSGTQAPQFR